MGNSDWVVRAWCVEKPKRPTLLSMKCDWVKYAQPIHIFHCHYKTLEMYAMLEKKKKNHPFFSGDIIDVLLWALQQNASECVDSIYETMCYFFVFFAMLMDNDLGRLPSFRQPGQRPVWCFLLMTLRIIGLEASQWNCNISLACNSSIYINSKLHLSHY